MPRVVELGGDPDLLSRNARVFDPLADLRLIAIRKSRINVSVSLAKSILDGFRDLVGLGLPCPQSEGGDLVARVESEGFSVQRSP